MKQLLKREQLPNFVKLPYKFDIDAINSFLKENADNIEDDLRAEGKYGKVVGEKCNHLQEVFGLKFNTIESAYSYMQKNDVKISKLEEGLPENRRMRWDFRKYVKNFDDYIIKTDDGKFEISGTPYKQIAITEYNPEESDREYEVKIPKSRLDERHYNKVREWAKNSIIESVISQFKGEVHRVRVAIMEPGAWVSEHIDYNCDYSIRIHIPLVTNSDCALSVRRRGEEKEILHMQADGSAWFINQGFLHSAWNKGATVRKHMILSIYGQEDILGAL